MVPTTVPGYDLADRAGNVRLVQLRIFLVEVMKRLRDRSEHAKQPVE